jgi:hypothetical protein
MAGKSDGSTLSRTLQQGLGEYAIGDKVRALRLKKKMGLVEPRRTSRRVGPRRVGATEGTEITEGWGHGGHGDHGGLGPRRARRSRRLGATEGTEITEG